jgi:type I restriction enzyme S subunit
MFGDPVRNTKHLPTEELHNLAKLERGKFTPRPRNDPSYYGGTYPFIQTGDITRSGGRITTWTQTLNKKGASVSKEFDMGTIVIAIVGATLGETAIVETPVYCPDSIIGITPHKDKATPEFIEFLLRLWKPRLRQLAPDAARANLNLERLRPLLALAPPIEEQLAFSRTATMLRSLVLAKQGSEVQLARLFSSLQQRAFRGELDLSRLVLPSFKDLSPVHEAKEPDLQGTILDSLGPFLRPSEVVEVALKGLDLNVGKGELIPWSPDYFKFRILGLHPAPFSFGEVMQKAESVFDEAPYEEIKDLILDLLGKGGVLPLLNQSFELHIDESTKETSGRREIVLGPAA